MNIQQHIIDANNMKISSLKKKYKLEYQSYKNMIAREKEYGAIIHPDFREFPQFLENVGIRKNKEYTLDRIDNNDPEYAPNKIRWADKTTQNNNRSNNIFLVHDDGRSMTIAKWASETNQKADTLYKRRTSGWSDMEIITGERDRIASIEDMPFPYDKKEVWEMVYMKQVLSGYGKTRLEFTVGFSNILLSDLSYKKHHIHILINQKSNYEYEHVTYYQMEYLSTNRKNISFPNIESYSELSLNELLTVNHENDVRLDRHRNYLDEATSMLEWVNKRQECIDKRANNVSKDIIISFFKKTYPKPEFTMNQPLKAISQP